jgi:F0F1-type ATP synthase assembly protein I
LSGHFEGFGLKTKKSLNWRVVRWLLKVQIALTIAVALLASLLMQVNIGWFVLLGGIAAMMLTAIAALRAFAIDADEAPGKALTAMYRGLAAKIIGAVVFFVIIAKLLPQQLPYTVIGFVAATIAYWVALLWAPMPAAPKIESIESRELEDRKLDG